MPVHNRLHIKYTVEESLRQAREREKVETRRPRGLTDRLSRSIVAATRQPVTRCGCNSSWAVTVRPGGLFVIIPVAPSSSARTVSWLPLASCEALLTGPFSLGLAPFWAMACFLFSIGVHHTFFRPPPRMHSEDLEMGRRQDSFFNTTTCTSRTVGCDDIPE